MRVSKHLFTAETESGWRTSIRITPSGKIEMNEGSGRVVSLSIKDVKKIVREYNKFMKENEVLVGE
jgi:hypothetical protein